MVVGVQLPTVSCVCSKEYESTYSELCPLQRLSDDLQATTSAPKTVKLATVKLATLRDHKYYGLPSTMFAPETMFAPKTM